MLKDPALEARAREIGQALRCVVCQNQSIDDSAAEVARDMRRAVRERLSAGDSDAQVFDFMVARYGDYVLLKPPFKLGTLLLWLGAPLVLLIAGGRHHADGLARAAPPRPCRRSATRSASGSGRCWGADARVPARASHHGDGRRAADPAAALARDIDEPFRRRARDLSRPARRDRARARRRHSERERSRRGAIGDRAPHPRRRLQRKDDGPRRPTPCIACCRPRLRWRYRCWRSAST